MDKSENLKSASADTTTPSEETTASASKQKSRGKKRKRPDSESISDIEDILPENTLEVEKNLHASAIKNNLDDVSVKKILKKVVTNDHVLALVKLQEEEEENAGVEESSLQPKLTRAKAKELMRASPKSAPWNLELTPIKHIPVKTRPEVTDLISKELPEDEDDEEYEPTHDDVQSDDEQTLESCSDLDSQPSTPATPGAPRGASPRVVTDGPFKVPQGLQTPARRKLIVEEEATIALRTRSKINLSATPIEHIESSFVPPDEVPTPIVDETWNQFLEELLNPGMVSRNEDDEEADPEYNVAADPDAHDEEEDALRGPFIKISKKELNDLVTELFGIIPEASVDEVLAENLAKDVLINNNSGQIPTHWDGKQEPISDEEVNQLPQAQPDSIFEKRESAIRFSIGKSEPEDMEGIEGRERIVKDVEIEVIDQSDASNVRKVLGKCSAKAMKESIEDKSTEVVGNHDSMPASIRALRDTADTVTVHVDMDDSLKILPEQLLVLQQQLRQHIQLAASNFLQTFVHPNHWKLAPTYRDYLDHFNKMLESYPDSIVNVCNLKPAIELCNTWETTVSEDTPENKKLVEFIQKEADRGRRRFYQNCLYVGHFPEMLMKVIANSPVFLYPYLLPAMPYRADSNRKFGYRRSEDNLIALGLDQFWQYIEDNPDLYKLPKPGASGARRGASGARSPRWGLVHACTLLCEHMLPWLTPKLLLSHISRARKDKDNPITKLFENREVSPVKHKLLPFNPSLTLYEQPEYEMPRIWARYLAKSSRRFRNHIYKRADSGKPPEGVPISVDVQQPHKNPLPIDFTQKIVATRVYYNEPDRQTDRQNSLLEPVLDKHDVIVKHNNTQPNIHLGIEGTGGKVPGPHILPGVALANLNSRESDNPNEAATAESTIIGIKTNESQEKAGPMLVIQSGVISVNTASPTKARDDGNYRETDENKVNVNKNMNDLKDISSLNVATPNDKVPGDDIPVGATTSLNACSNMFQIVPTTVGMFLVPIKTPQDTTTDNTRISAVNNKNNLEDIMKTLKQSKIHCPCCVLLRKLTKRQTKITDYFKQTENKQCECTSRKYPRISKRLKMLVNNYKSRFLCEKSHIDNMIQSLAKTKNGEVEPRNVEAEDDGYNLEDIAFVTSFQMKLTSRALLIRNVYTKKRINNAFSDFDPTTDDPMALATRIRGILMAELVDLYKEFIGFLTAEQADRIDSFKDYFVQNCLKDLLKRVEEEVKDVHKKATILFQLNGILSDNISTSCELCTGILNTLPGYPRLAEYVFSLFPHRVDGIERDRCKGNSINPPTCQSSEQPLSHTTPTGKDKISQDIALNNSPTSKAKKHIQGPDIIEQSVQDSNIMDIDDHNEELTICDENPPDNYEADHSSCGEDNEETNSVNDRPRRRESTSKEMKFESTEHTNFYETEITISKTEVQEHSDSTNMSPLVMSEDEPVKAEAPDWKREEDKLILEILLQYLTPQERKEKTILEILDEKSVYHTIAEGLPHKSVDDVKDRVMYLLDILVMSEY